MRKKSGRKKTMGIAYRKSALAMIAFWQFMTFLMLLLMVWVNEVLDLPSVLFASKVSHVDIFGGCVLSAFVILVGVISVSYTYLQHKRLLSQMITVCSRCQKVKIDAQLWDEIEDFLSQQSGAPLSHGLCPDCYDKEMEALKRDLHGTPLPREISPTNATD